MTLRKFDTEQVLEFLKAFLEMEIDYFFIGFHVD